ncbi:hypothetical protein JEQ12_019525 [Ovis aries]|uniref:Apoptosis regulator Bcl-2 family BH4 domain-containing protein n=1 Tax=Ovis aries TaxID=9940 RepID=A0A836CZ88_SHEEP|nr:hypothetical protein JEQ12_019525 [Ovis aries]
MNRTPVGRVSGILDSRLVEPILIIKISQSNWELVVDFLSYKLSQRGYSNAISGNPSWHLAGSPAVNGATGHSRSLDAREVIPMAAVKQALREAGNEFELSGALSMESTDKEMQSRSVMYGDNFAVSRPVISGFCQMLYVRQETSQNWEDFQQGCAVTRSSLSSSGASAGLI